MSKTYLEQVAKARFLTDGLRKNINLVTEHGITAANIEDLERLASEAEVLNSEVEKLKEQTSARIKVASQKLAELKERMTPLKSAVKAGFLQPEWIKFGVQDKR